MKIFEPRKLELEADHQNEDNFFFGNYFFRARKEISHRSKNKSVIEAKMTRMCFFNLPTRLGVGAPSLVRTEISRVVKALLRSIYHFSHTAPLPNITRLIQRRRAATCTC